VRKRYRFLAHLPLGSPAWFAEVDLRGQLSKETKELFADEFAKRRQWKLKEKAKNKREERHGKHMAAVEEEQYYAAMNQRLPGIVEVLPTKQDFAVDLQGRAIEEPEEVADANGEEAAEGADEEGPSLADRIKEKMSGKAKPAKGGKAAKAIAVESEEYFPTLGSGAARSSNSSSSAWGASKGSSLAAARNPRATDSWGGEPREAEAAQQPAEVPDSWEEAAFGQEEPTLGEALEAALRKSTSQPTPVAAEEVPDPAAQKAAGKKKKGKATTIRLFG